MSSITAHPHESQPTRRVAPGQQKRAAAKFLPSNLPLKPPVAPLSSQWTNAEKEKEAQRARQRREALGYYSTITASDRPVLDEMLDGFDTKGSFLSVSKRKCVDVVTTTTTEWHFTPPPAVLPSTQSQQPRAHSSSSAQPQQPRAHSSSSAQPQQPRAHSSSSTHPQQPRAPSSSSTHPQQPRAHSSSSAQPQQQPRAHSSSSAQPQQPRAPRTIYYLGQGDEYPRSTSSPQRPREKAIPPIPRPVIHPPPAVPIVPSTTYSDKGARTIVYTCIFCGYKADINTGVENIKYFCTLPLMPALDAIVCTQCDN